MNAFAGKTAIITGGGSGIGKALGRELALAGCRVVLADIDGDAAVAAAQAIQVAGGEASGVALDVVDASQVQDLVRSVRQQRGRLDLLFNNAGVSMVGEARDVRPESWRRVLDVNLHGVIHGVQAAYPAMIAQGFGQIVNTASITGLVPFPLGVVYNTSKFAVVGLSMSLRTEALGYGVKVNVVCPGFIDTPMQDRLEYVGIDKNRAMRELPFKLRPVERCARAILHGVARDRPIVVVTPEAKALWILHRLAPRLTLTIGRFAARRSRRLRVDLDSSGAGQPG